MVFVFAGLHVFLSESGFSGFLDFRDVGCVGAVVFPSYLVFGLFLVLPVVSYVFGFKSLIFNGNQFCSFAGVFYLVCCDRVLCSFLFPFKKKVRNVEEITSTILLALFHFFCNIKSLNIAEYSQFFCLEKKKNCCAIWRILFLQCS